jgi:hypothetical protein
VQILQLEFAFGRLLSDPKASFRSQSRRVAVAAAVKVTRAEASAAAAPQQRNALSTELNEEGLFVSMFPCLGCNKSPRPLAISSCALFD